MKKTKIVCTIGPASLQKETIKKMIAAGMNAARINTAYGDMNQYRLITQNLRSLGNIPLILDLKGPEIRLKTRQERSVQKHDVFEVGFSDEEISFNHDFYSDVDISDIIYFDNGKIKTRIVKKENKTLHLSVIVGGKISNGKGVNIPNKCLSVSTLSKKDIELTKFAIKSNVEYIALSFTRRIGDVHNLEKILKGFKGSIIAKIENSEGFRNFEKILGSVSGIMIARGDLGVELRVEKVPLIQKSLIRKCNQSGKPVITATDMLESMIYKPIPTRAEVSDVANAVLDGTDAVMLSGETSIGNYPIDSVLMMSRIVRDVEGSVKSHVIDGEFVDISNTISKSIQRISQSMSINKIVTLTRSGYTARMIARFKIVQPILAVTPQESVAKQLELVFGIYPVHIDYLDEEDRIIAVAKNLYSMGLIKKEDTILFTAAFRTAKKHASNIIEIHNIKELLDFGKSNY
ncbi:pyruvate kinase [Candidatus Bathyarchaeota archaeon]|nr:pyruvate kinase [Candidatus Bathyarchaeota archaeon]